MNSLQIYNERLVAITQINGIRDRSCDYFTFLSDVIRNEIATAAYSPLVESFLENRKAEAVSVMAVFDALCFMNNIESPVECLDFYIHFIPAGKMVAWRKLDSDYEVFEFNYLKFRSWMSNLYVGACENVRRIKEFAPPVSRNSEKAQAVEDASIKRAETQAEKILDKAKADAQTTKENAVNEANEILREAKKQAEELLRKAKDKEEVLIKETLRQNEAEKREARSQIEKERFEAVCNAERERKQILNRDAKSETERIIKCNLDGYMSERERGWAEYVEENRNQSDEVAREFAQAKADACARSNELQSKISEFAGNVTSFLDALKSETYAYFNEWQQSFYKGEFRPLAICYINLSYIIADLDKRIETLLLNPENGELEELQKIRCTLDKFRKSFESAINKVGLKTIQPDKGEVFNSDYHVVDGEQDNELFNGRLISKCKGAGVMYSPNGVAQTLYVPALVSVEENKQEEEKNE